MTKADNVAPAGWEAISGLIKDEDALTEGRNKLAKSALACFAKQGYSETSVNDIAEAAGVSIGSVYKYVRAKEDILWLVSEAGFEGTNEAVARAMSVEGSATVKLDALVDSTIRQADSDRDLVRLLYVEFRYLPQPMQQRLRDQEERHVGEVTSLIEQGNAAKEFDCDDPRMVAIAVSMFTSTWILKRHMFRRISLAEYIKRHQAMARHLAGAKTA